MCGIAGIYSYRESAPPVDEQELLRIREHMIKRGPDGADLWISPDRKIGLAHRRLAIIDLSEAGAQPMATADGLLRITFNGEIYNYRELRRDLEAKGYVFRSNSDTEVLLHLYADRGEEMVHALRGMFAFGLWDVRERTLFLARDPFGIKPLYYAKRDGTLRFASQVKALLAGSAIDTTHEPAGSAGFLLWGYVPEPFTLYRNIVALPAGSILTVRADGKAAPQTYFSVRDVLVQAQTEARPFGIADRESLDEALRDSVRQHLVADVPVGIFLSAGADSSLVASIAAELDKTTLRSLTLGFREYQGQPNDEVPLAERIAANLGTRHTTRWIERKDFDEQAATILEAMDQPSTDGINTYLICREAARQGVKVALSGIGGDELFGGYPSFHDVPGLRRWLRIPASVPLLGRLVRALAHPVLSRVTSPKYAGLLEYGGSDEGAYLLRRALFMPWELREVLDQVAVHVGLERLATLASLGGSIRGIRSTHARVTALELGCYMRSQLLRDADWAGMAHSVEVRVPLVDAKLFRRLAPWLAGESPPRKADAGSSIALPQRKEALARPKSGFSVPVREWITGVKTRGPATERGLRVWARRVLPPLPRQHRVLALVGDAYGSFGGIAKFNRDLLHAISHMPECAQVVVVPRQVPGTPVEIPNAVRFVKTAARGKASFVRAVLREVLSGPFDLVIAGHINLSFLALLVAAVRRAKAALVIHGIDAWTRHPEAFVRLSLARMDLVLGVSQLTLKRFAAWSGVVPERMRLLQNCVDLRTLTPGTKSEQLAKELGLSGRRVLMTFGRLASEEKYKGFDEVIESLPALARELPDIAYLICGEGNDRARLIAKAAALGVADRVIFAGFVSEDRKPDYYRLADAYVMPSRGEGFGIVLLEALACGLPVMASKVDGSREALLDGELGELVDPAQPEEVREGIRRTLRRGKGMQQGIHLFSAEAFQVRASGLIREALAC